LAELQVYDVNFGTTKYEHSVLRKYFLKTAVSDRGSISLVFWCPYFESRFPTVVFQYLRCLLLELLGVGTDRRHGRFQLPTPNNSIGPSEVARGGFKAGCFRLPLVGGRFLKGSGVDFGSILSGGFPFPRATCCLIGGVGPWVDLGWPRRRPGVPISAPWGLRRVAPRKVSEGNARPIQQ
jgi:hypothetical protein